jgi:hypothetical protein
MYIPIHQLGRYSIVQRDQSGPFTHTPSPIVPSLPFLSFPFLPFPSSVTSSHHTPSPSPSPHPHSHPAPLISSVPAAFLSQTTFTCTPPPSHHSHPSHTTTPAAVFCSTLLCSTLLYPTLLYPTLLCYPLTVTVTLNPDGPPSTTIDLPPTTIHEPSSTWLKPPLSNSRPAPSPEDPRVSCSVPLQTCIHRRADVTLTRYSQELRIISAYLSRSSHESRSRTAFPQPDQYRWHR